MDAHINIQWHRQPNEPSACASRALNPNQFEAAARRSLEQAPGLGPVFVQRLLEIGIDSLEDIVNLGPNVVIDRLCQLHGSSAIANRRRALSRFMASMATTDGTDSGGLT